MSNYSVLKALLDTKFYENSNNEITGTKANEAVKAMVDSLGAGYQFMGVATPTTNPGTIDQRVYYFASAPGTYTYFDGTTVLSGQLVCFYYDTAWHSALIFDFSDDELEKLRAQMGMESVEITWSDGGLTLSGEITTGNYSTSQFIAVTPGERIFYESAIGSSSRLGIAGYTAADETTFVDVLPHIPSGNPANKQRDVIIPTGVNYIRISHSNTYAGNYGVYRIPFGKGFGIKVCTQAEYDAMDIHNSNILFLIKEA